MSEKYYKYDSCRSSGLYMIKSDMERKEGKYGNPKFYEILEQIKNLYVQKNDQYAVVGDTERNFKDGAYLLKKFFKGVDNKELAYLITLISKQYLGVIDIVAENKKGTIESLKDKFQDISIYSIIAMILIDDYPYKDDKIEG